MKQYKSQRGVIQTTRPYGDLSKEEREQIIREFLQVGKDPVLEKWNITRQTLNQLKFHYRWLIELVEEENLEKANV